MQRIDWVGESARQASCYGAVDYKSRQVLQTTVLAFAPSNAYSPARLGGQMGSGLGTEEVLVFMHAARSLISAVPVALALGGARHRRGRAGGSRRRRFGGDDHQAQLGHITSAGGDRGPAVHAQGHGDQPPDYEPARDRAGLAASYKGVDADARRNQDARRGSAPDAPLVTRLTSSCPARSRPAPTTCARARRMASAPRSRARRLPLLGRAAITVGGGADSTSRTRVTTRRRPRRRAATTPERRPASPAPAPHRPPRASTS